jgi:hypothetical protein
MEAPEGRTGGSLVLRAWLEGPQELRVRITSVVGGNDPSTVVSATVDGACAMVRSWLMDLLESGDASRDAGSPPE